MKEIIMMFEIGSRMFIGPYFEDAHGNKIVRITVDGYEKEYSLGKLKIIW